MINEFYGEFFYFQGQKSFSSVLFQLNLSIPWENRQNWRSFDSELLFQKICIPSQSNWPVEIGCLRFC